MALPSEPTEYAKTRYPHLFSPLKVGNITLRHRIIFSPHWTAHWDPVTFHGNPRAFNYYKERCEGGVALCYLGNSSPSPMTDYNPTTQIGWWRDDIVPSIKRIVDMIHDYGIPCVAQFSLEGHHNVPWNSEFLLVPARSSVEINSTEFPPYQAYVAKQMEEEEIWELMGHYASAAQKAIAAGCDGVEGLTGHGKMPNQFFSPAVNKRTDQWGGDPTGLGAGEGRARFILEIARALRKGAGPDKTCSIRVNGDDFEPGWASSEHWVQLAKLLEEDGKINYVNITEALYRTLYWMISPSYSGPEPGYEAPWVAKIKEAIKLPVIQVGHINSPELAERLVAEGTTDLIGIVRGQIADPHFVRKTMEGREEEIRPCIRCNQGCLWRTFFRGIGGVRCAVNPTAGEEMEWGSWTETKATKAKKVLILGAGAAGSECARELAERGHKPVVYEKDSAIGGQVRMWARMPGSSETLDYVEWMSRELERLKVPIKFNTEITEANVEDIIAKEKPDEIVVATGSHVDKTGHSAETEGPVPGWDKPHVFTYEDIFTEGFDLGKLGNKVLVADLMNDRRPMRVLEALLKAGKDVQFITMRPEPSTVFLFLTGEAVIAKANVVAAGGVREKWNPNRIRVETWIAEITDKGAKLVYIYDFAHPWEEEYDSIVLVPTRRTNTNIYNFLKEKGYKPRLIGDANAPRELLHATHEGYATARYIEEPRLPYRQSPPSW